MPVVEPTKSGSGEAEGEADASHGDEPVVSALDHGGITLYTGAGDSGEWGNSCAAQLAVLQPRIAVIDEIDSGLDITPCATSPAASSR